MNLTMQYINDRVSVDGNLMDSFTPRQDAEWFIKYNPIKDCVLARTYTNMFGGGRLEKVYDKRGEELLSFLEN